MSSQNSLHSEPASKPSSQHSMDDSPSASTQPECTQRFYETEEEDQDEPDSAPPTPARLVRVESGGDGASNAVPEGGLLIGRLRCSEYGGSLVLEDPRKKPPVVSSKHALLLEADGSLKLRILSASAWTFVNEAPYQCKETPLAVPLYHGDLVRFGGGKKESERYDRFIYRVVAPTYPRPAPAVEPPPPPQWFWQSSLTADAWSAYPPVQSELIEAAWQRREQRVVLDASRQLDFDSMRQGRTDDPTKTRRVRREPPIVTTDEGAGDGGASSRDDGAAPEPKRSRRGAGGAASSSSPGGAREPDYSPAMRATVRVALLSRESGKLVVSGSGTIVSRDGHILTAAHLLIHPKSGHKLCTPDRVLAVGLFEAHDQPSRWAYWAEVETEDELLREKDAKGRLLDLAVLRIRGNLTLDPPVFTAREGPYSIRAEGREPPPQFPHPLRLASRPAEVKPGSPLVVIGWPSPHNQTTIFIDSTHECLAREGTLIRTRAFIHAGSSGGPALNRSLQVVGVISHNPGSSDDTLRPEGEERYLACIRSTERVELRAGQLAADGGPQAISMRWPAVVPPQPEGDAPRANPLQPFVLTSALLDLQLLGLACNVEDGTFELRPPRASAGGGGGDGGDATAAPCAGTGRLSRSHPMTLDPAARQAALVPPAATHFAFGYPCTSPDSSRLQEYSLGESFAAAGGFVYFTHSLAACEGEDEGRFQLCGATSLHRSAGQGLQFDGPVPLRDPLLCRQQLETQDRLHQATLDFLLSVGVKHFCWLGPREALGPNDGSAWQHGGFVYLFDEEQLDCVFVLREAREHQPLARLPRA